MEKVRLSPDAVVSAALDIADAEGLSAVTIRRIAGEFGVTPMAMYWHFENKNALLDAMGRAVVESIDLPDGELGEIGAGLTEILAAIVRALRAHPESTPLVPAQMLAVVRGQELTERSLELLARAGCSVAEAANIVRTGMDLCVTMVTGESRFGVLGHGASGAADAWQCHLAEKKQAIRELPEGRYPRIVAAAGPLTALEDADEFYASSIDLFVAGVVARSRGTLR
ncbi:TetR/AcrR family transcriptional regulator [Psychromicrobium xiongbiense]|uniref:TetR/AcrR family transcriptional regulator n=1 Tax=Psychromicrobium xiongbiense TaxID=3051184 RepID=UPI0025525356|nr:TetR/AcrR family transcriptional regulator [Psychromicrobium sp. YIM S02556]